tara:strand:+ start:9484 stop:9864 length:381 start_codon:yes stop_codon:yes gene_type:complete
MQIITDLGGISRVQFPGIRQILTQRISQIELREGEALADVGAFFVVEKGDCTRCLETTTGCYLVTDPLEDHRFGDEEFEPSFEWLERHIPEQCFEIAFTMTDDYFVAVFVPDDLGIWVRLRQYVER